MLVLARQRDAAHRQFVPTHHVATVLAAAGLCLAALACADRRATQAVPEDSTLAPTDTAGRPAATPVLTPQDSAVAAAAAAPPPASTASTAPVPTPVLSPLADSIAQYLVFAPTVQTWFLAAKRGKRLLVDLGRIDIDIHHDHRRAAAFADAVKALSPMPLGTPLHLYHTWGQDDATIAGFGDWNGRIVATLNTPPHLDSLVRAAPTAYAAVMRVDTAQHADSGQHTDTAPGAKGDSGRQADSVRHADTTAHRPDHAAGADTTAAAPRDSCRRDSITPELVARSAIVRDSLDQWLRSQPPPPYDRLVITEKSQSTQITGCFGGANRVAMAVDLRAGDNEWIRERAVLMDTLGHVTTLRVDDYRFKGHDFVGALDPNGSGVDGVAAKGVTQASGATVILALTPRNRLSRWVSGFAWEAR